jgi:spore coat polysaccharide biosynthesis predicted glycosyltransferase SpsG
MRLIFSSHDELGLGHVRRNVCVARALADVVSGHVDPRGHERAEAEVFEALEEASRW